jgi:thioester reductase-like protein
MTPAGDVPVAGDADPILLTGATGFVGGFVLAELLARGAKVICLARGGQSRRDDLVRSLAGLGAWRAGYDGLLTVVDGDVGLPRLGLDRATFACLSGSVGRIIHCAAWVNHLYPFPRLATVNSHSAADLLELAVSARRKSLTFVSTSAVFAGSEQTEFGTEALAALPSERDGYARSKAIAEMYFMRAGEFGVPATIVRIPNIFGDRVRFQVNRRDAVWGWVKAILVTRRYPAGYALAGNDFVQALPGDVTARLIADADRPSDPAGCRVVNAIPHLVCGTRSLLAGLRAAGYDPAPMPGRQWHELVGGLSAHEVWVAPIAADHARNGGDEAPVRLPRVSLHDHPEISQLVNAHAIWSPADLAGYIRTLAGS